KKLDTELFLFYSNRTEDDIAFKKELDYWQAINKNIKIFYTVTESQPRDKTCLFGHIDKKLLYEKAYNLAETIIYIFGPPGMVEAMTNLAMETACKKENIRIEKFVGY
ncbi:MAG: oxidoreductase, partial [Candidatus Omnitrophota bacterium]